MLNKVFLFSLVVGILVPNAVEAEQVIRQQARTSATAVGNNNYAASRIHSSATQNQSGNFEPYRNRQRQITVQNGSSRATAIGNDNNVVSKIEQRSVQNLPGYGDRTNQSVKQSATSNAVGIGDRNTINNSTGQYNRQNQWSY